MCEFLERVGLRGTPTEEVREWSAMTHRVVELSGPFPTPDDRRIELWLHEESATRLLDMCDRIDTEFDRTKTENAKLREFAQAMAEVAYEGQMLCDKCRFSHGCYNGGKKEHEGRGCQWLLWARELGIEADA